MGFSQTDGVYDRLAFSMTLSEGFDVAGHRRVSYK